jgi:GH15 family glucan-1,4-alpha-glucosidase
MIAKSVKMLKSLQYGNGLLSATRMDVKTGYNASWIRDNVYTALGFEATKNYKELKKVYHALLDILLKHEYKIDWAIKNKPTEKYQYIHPRYNPDTMEEFWDNWGNKQNDSIGALLFKIGDLEHKGIKIVRNNDDLRILQKLVHYLLSIQYWQDPDNGVWEENEEVHASSVGACVAGLKKIKSLVYVPEILIKRGEHILKILLPRESMTKDVDLALLSLIYPYNVVDKKMALKILENVENKLVREKGVIRYQRDAYYSHNNMEAEWTMGFPWQAICYKQVGRLDKYSLYMRKSLSAMNEKGELPELYYAQSNIHNENSPLGWSQALFIVMNKM